MATTAEYFKHARSLAPFPAHQALALAREAAALDRLAIKVQQPVIAWYEVLPDGSNLVKFSNGIKVY
jgi:hypothetical protein